MSVNELFKVNYIKKKQPAEVGFLAADSYHYRCSCKQINYDIL